MSEATYTPISPGYGEVLNSAMEREIAELEAENAHLAKMLEVRLILYKIEDLEGYQNYLNDPENEWVAEWATVKGI